MRWVVETENGVEVEMGGRRRRGRKDVDWVGSRCDGFFLLFFCLRCSKVGGGKEVKDESEARDNLR